MDRNMQDLINELLLFPRGKHDDLLDGFYYANKGSYEPHHETKEESIPVLGRAVKKAVDWMTV